MSLTARPMVNRTVAGGRRTGRALIVEDSQHTETSGSGLERIEQCGHVDRGSSPASRRLSGMLPGRQSVITSLTCRPQRQVPVRPASTADRRRRFTATQDQRSGSKTPSAAAVSAESLTIVLIPLRPRTLHLSCNTCILLICPKLI